MTDKQVKQVAEALKATSRSFAQPQQAHILKAVCLDNKVDPKVADTICTDFGPFFNASAMLQTLKKAGVIPAEMSAKAKAEAEALAKALKA